ncbi:hypothetical protein RHSIM_Rhsim06G0139700 [Rhododendron simsii]|uniref:Uncharacterized protein n=1 Tax=Rhododendron simsii TaxID=118357 RepID=A0A834LNQ8_RHOSS|nr:hypothetical protein RHSIM_Rhsim06G0139700 [Rhododendron simsii]
MKPSPTQPYRHTREVVPVRVLDTLPIGILRQMGGLLSKEVDHFSNIDNLLQKDGFRGVYQSTTLSNEISCRPSRLGSAPLNRSGSSNCGVEISSQRLTLCLTQEEITSQELLSRSQQSYFTRASKSRSLLVGNIHVLFNPKRGDIKLGQGLLVLAYQDYLIFFFSLVFDFFLRRPMNCHRSGATFLSCLLGTLTACPRFFVHFQLLISSFSAMYQFLGLAESVIRFMHLDLQLHDRRNISGAIRPLEFQPSQHQDKYAVRLYS